MRHLLIFFAFNCFVLERASAQDSVVRQACGYPPVVSDETLREEIVQQTRKDVGSVREETLRSKVEKTTQDILYKYPGADKLRINLYVLYQVCALLALDQAMPTVQKICLINRVLKEIEDGKKASVAIVAPIRWIDITLIGSIRASRSRVDVYIADALAMNLQLNELVTEFPPVKVSPGVQTARFRASIFASDGLTIDDECTTDITIPEPVGVGGLIRFEPRLTFARGGGQRGKIVYCGMIRRFSR